MANQPADQAWPSTSDGRASGICVAVEYYSLRTVLLYLQYTVNAIFCLLTYPAATSVHLASHVVQHMSRQSNLKSLLPFFCPSVQSDISASGRCSNAQMSPLG